MSPRLYLHQPGICTLEPPRLGPQLAGFLAGLALALSFGAAATLALAGGVLRHMIRPPWAGHEEVRWLVLVLGSVNCFASVLVASGFGIRLFAVLAHRLGWHPVLESEGPCRLVQDAPGLWGLQMELSTGTDPGVPWPLTTQRRLPASCHLFFRLDEAAAGSISHLTNPDETLVVRWLDLPSGVGGPTILEVRSPLREYAVEEDDERIRRAA